MTRREKECVFYGEEMEGGGREGELERSFARSERPSF